MSRTEFAIDFAGKTIQWAQTELQLTAQEVAQAVGANRKTVVRWREGQSAPTSEHRQHLERLNQIRFLMETSFRSLETRRRWLHTPAPGLKGRTPFAALAEGNLDEVVGLLGTLTAGAFL